MIVDIAVKFAALEVVIIFMMSQNKKRRENTYLRTRSTIYFFMNVNSGYNVQIPPEVSNLQMTLTKPSFAGSLAVVAYHQIIATPSKYLLVVATTPQSGSSVSKDHEIH